MFFILGRMKQKRSFLPALHLAPLGAGPSSPSGAALPTATATPHTHHGDVEQRRRRPQRPLLHRTRLQRPRLATPPQTCTPQPAPCGGTPRVFPQPPVWSWWRAHPGSTAAQHAAHRDKSPTGVAVACRCARTPRAFLVRVFFSVAGFYGEERAGGGPRFSLEPHRYG